MRRVISGSTGCMQQLQQLQQLMCRVINWLDEEELRTFVGVQARWFVSKLWYPSYLSKTLLLMVGSNQDTIHMWVTMWGISLQYSTSSIWPCVRFVSVTSSPSYHHSRLMGWMFNRKIEGKEDEWPESCGNQFISRCGNWVARPADEKLMPTLLFSSLQFNTPKSENGVWKLGPSQLRSVTPYWTDV